MKRWFKQCGPVRWYRREWLVIECSTGARLRFSILIKRNYLRVDIGGIVHKRSLFGNPSSIEPRWTFSRGCFGW
jgi:hypothetical protein